MLHCYSTMSLYEYSILVIAQAPRSRVMTRLLYVRIRDMSGF